METNFTLEPPQLPWNVAWRTPAWQSSTLDDDELAWGAWKATDGHIFGVPYENGHDSTENLLSHLSSCSQTKVEDRPWLVLQLDRAMLAQDLLVHIYGREECCELSLDNLTIAVGSQMKPESHRVCQTFGTNPHIGKYKLLSVRCQSGGNFLSIQADGLRVSLSICEVYVFQDLHPEPFSHKGESCFDEVRYCDEWKGEGDCRTDNSRYCRRTCGLCGANIRRVIARPTHKFAAAVQGHAECKDKHRYCRFYAANGLCGDKAAHCQLSCNRCPVATATTQRASPTSLAPRADCRDRDVNCKHWVPADYCKYEHISNNFCRKSCGTC